ncbi:hypothetical protein N7509_008212 [Penicillium cosmopolitanum]|uniref:Rhodopsin domain-containing protein n=1 Tax=Penicillium cosmopolitanum TaxID=1131564 RepID=A0A9X0B2F4_9EURO|nr:uncharacterized protein N7509_008212 [Penicillium cosmopolitanum]KAJ5385671.1 hypothetical protein N7509_008212 [Penicillium cosmopolitanum]
MTQQPAIPPPVGLSSDFSHPKGVLHTVNLVTQVLCIILVTIFVSIRIWIKAQYHRSLSIEDYLTIAGWDSVNVYGGGYNAWDVTETEFVKFQKASYATTLIYVPMVFVIKLALLAVMARIFAPHREKVKVIYISIGIMLCYYIPAFFIKVFFCDPISIYWLGTSNGGKCLDQRKVIIADSVISIAGDLWILLLPVPMIWSVQMTRAKKMRVVGILGAGDLLRGLVSGDL